MKNKTKSIKKENTSLFLTGFLQVYFVAINTYFIANKLYIGVIMAAFMISFIWSFNVKKIAFGTNKDRIIYSIGASIGSIAGLFCATYIQTLFII
jgi:hypothetical protein